MRKFSLLSCLSISLLFVMISCTKEGPEGPAGAAGAQGPPGSNGAAGAAGAGVTTYSNWFVSGDAWVEPSATDPFYGQVAQFIKTASVVTQDIIDKGVVLCYMKGDPLLADDAAATPFQLPYSIGVGFGFTDQYDYTLAPGQIWFLYKSDNPWAPEDLAPISYRYVVIPGTINTTGRNASSTYAGYTKEELKQMSYNQVVSLFHIPATGTNIK